MSSMNKKGAEMAIGTIVIIIISLVVLVVVIFGFGAGWQNLWNNIIGFGGGEVNVQTVVSACSLACSTSSTYDFCERNRDVVFDKTQDGQDNPLSKLYTCDKLANVPNIGLSKCTNIVCGAGTQKGTCTGEIVSNPDCRNADNLGEIKCENEDLIGCIWSGQINSNDPNLGTCEYDEITQCASFNDNKDSCDSLRNAGCTWVPDRL